MTDLKRFTTAELCARLNGELRGRGDLPITGIAALDEAGPEEITFIADEAHARRWPSSRAAAAVITRRLMPTEHAPEQRALIAVDSAETASIAVLGLFAPSPDRPEEGVHPSAVVDPTATIGEGARLGPHVTVGPRTVIGRGVTLHPGVHLYADVHVGAGSELHAGCVVRERCRLGERVILHQNVSIGADGFGYRPAADGRGLEKVPHIGHVVIEDDVEIGSGTCIDRAKFSATVIGAGTKIDNMVQIAHNCRIGPDCVIAGLAGIAGSVSIGAGVQIGAQAGIVEHVRVGDRARIGAQAGVMQDVPAGQSVLGTPADDVRQTLRQFASIRKLPGLIRDLSRRPDAGGER